MQQVDHEETTAQLQHWTGEFGTGYRERNDFAPWKMPLGVEAYRRMIGGLEVRSILEVGCNIGLNLSYINELFGGVVKLHGVEPNGEALEELKARPGIELAGAWNTSAFDVPLDDGAIDLVLTSGVLIHIAPGDLPRATDEIVRVASRYVLCVEYFSHRPEEIPYHGQQGLLYKRDFGKFYKDRYPQLTCVDYGFLWQEEFRIFDNLNWWLFEKR
ncbi:MAG: methyltransferase domain-containing protein [Proteobacteria bacterium]|nr:methyltransferase domain-containing protein [Pseudomonadota bacterium]MBU1687939.1 methyltransferase domain-containing protein [Pseudomonadota bacterium]